MAVDNAEIIDAIGTERGTGDVVLTISDHLSWGTEHDEMHIEVLSEKLAMYEDFIATGQLQESFPNAINRLPVISVACMEEPSDRGILFFKEYAKNKQFSVRYGQFD